MFTTGSCHDRTLEPPLHKKIRGHHNWKISGVEIPLEVISYFKRGIKYIYCSKNKTTL